MPASFSFELVFPPAPPPGFSALPFFPAPGSAAPCNAQMMDLQAFLDLFDRLFPAEYLDPKKLSPNSGYEHFRAAAALGERVSLALERMECGSFFMFAEGGARARVVLQVTRLPLGGPEVTLLAGTRVSTSKGRRQFVFLQDLTIAAGIPDDPPTVLVEAVADGWEYNVRGERVTPSGVRLPGEIDTMEMAIMSPFVAGVDFEVENLLDAEGGRSAMLDGLADDRGMERLPGETDGQLALRARSLPDTVSPAAMVRAVARRLDPLGLDFDFCETFEHRYQETYDAPSVNVGTPSYQATPPTNPAFNTNTFVYDDPRPVSTVHDFPRNRTMDEAEYRGAFVVTVPNNVTLFDLGLAYDDPGTEPSDFRDPGTGKTRGTPAYDITRLAEEEDFIFTAAYDGWDFARAAAYYSLLQDLQAIKPAGVAVIIETIRR